jgi:tetratricopeptide (TPR) repeat protein
VREDLAVSPSASNQLAHIYYLGGSVEKARATLEVVLEADPNSALAHNNIAVAYAAAGDYEAALRHCMAAVDSEPDDPGIWLNLGLLRYASGEAESAESALSKGLARCDGFEDACHLLGMQVADDDSRAAVAALTSEEVQALLWEVLFQLPAPEIAVGAQDSSAAEETAVSSAEPEFLEPPKPIRLRVAAARAAEQLELADHLYWKQEEKR